MKFDSLSSLVCDHANGWVYLHFEEDWNYPAGLEIFIGRHSLSTWMLKLPQITKEGVRCDKKQKKNRKSSRKGDEHEPGIC